MANQGYITIIGEAQGLISAGCSTQASIGNKCQAAHTDEIMVLSFNHNMSHVGNINHATHQPVYISKNLDKSSPLLAQAQSSLEKLQCVIDLYRTCPSGAQEKFYTIELKDAVITNLTMSVPHVIAQNDLEAEEDVAFRYRSITWTHHIAGTSGDATWSR